jgi:hypothetical protein
VNRTLLLLVLLACPAAAQPHAPWREAPEYVRLFAPARHAAAYRAYVSPLPIDKTVARLLEDPAMMRPPGAWGRQELLPLEAFGQSGPYPRWPVLRLYGARRASVARGPAGRDGFVTESWTLISPYPDASLQRLQPGTLLIVLQIP